MSDTENLSFADGFKLYALMSECHRSNIRLTDEDFAILLACRIQLHSGDIGTFSPKNLAEYVIWFDKLIDKQTGFRKRIEGLIAKSGHALTAKLERKLRDAGNNFTFDKDRIEGGGIIPTRVPKPVERYLDDDYGEDPSGDRNGQYWMGEEE